MRDDNTLILIVDDAALNNVLITEAVSRIENCTPVSFTQPLEALAFVRENAGRIGVATIDYDMPDLDGMGFIRAARQVPAFAHVPVVMVTSFDQRRVRREALAAGVSDFVGKPFDPVEIRVRLTNLLALNQARREQQDHATWLAGEVATAVSLVEARECEIVTRLARVAEHRDTDTGDHVVRVGRYASLIAQGLGCEASWCSQIALAATMHDIGKVAIPDTILLKPGPLTDDETRLSRRHVTDGYAILRGSTSEVIQLAAQIALNHHERWDGGGYPHGLAGDAIPLCGRIVAVADVFDALLAERPYKRRWTIAQAKYFLAENAGIKFDPRCVEVFMKSWSDVLAIAQSANAQAPAFSSRRSLALDANAVTYARR